MTKIPDTIEGAKITVNLCTLDDYTQILATADDGYQCSVYLKPPVRQSGIDAAVVNLRGMLKQHETVLASVC